MEYYDKKDSVDEYIKMAEGYDGKELISVLAQHLPAGAAVLELGMGPGKDLDLLEQSFLATGSDLSDVFLSLYRETHPDADLIKLDAAALETDRSFDCVYSNKVLQHLTKAEAKASFIRQREILRDGGIAMHSLWYGKGEEKFCGLLSVYYTEDELVKTIGDGFAMIEMSRYTEMEEGDSIYVVLRKK